MLTAICVRFRQRLCSTVFPLLASSKTSDSVDQMKVPDCPAWRLIRLQSADALRRNTTRLRIIPDIFQPRLVKVAATRGGIRNPETWRVVPDRPILILTFSNLLYAVICIAVNVT